MLNECFCVHLSPRCCRYLGGGEIDTSATITVKIIGNHGRYPLSLVLFRVESVQLRYRHQQGFLETMDASVLPWLIFLLEDHKQKFCGVGQETVC